MRPFRLIHLALIAALVALIGAPAVARAEASLAIGDTAVSVPAVGAEVQIVTGDQGAQVSVQAAAVEAQVEATPAGVEAAASGGAVQVRAEGAGDVSVAAKAPAADLATRADRAGAVVRVQAPADVDVHAGRGAADTAATPAPGAAAPAHAATPAGPSPRQAAAKPDAAPADGLASSAKATRRERQAVAGERVERTVAPALASPVATTPADLPRAAAVERSDAAKRGASSSSSVVDLFPSAASGLVSVASGAAGSGGVPTAVLFALALVAALLLLGPRLRGAVAISPAVPFLGRLASPG